MNDIELLELIAELNLSDDRAKKALASEIKRLAFEPLASLRARVGELERERDAAVSDLQDAVDFVYKVYGESSETLAAITTGHWRAVIASAKGAK